MASPPLPNLSWGWGDWGQVAALLLAQATDGTNATELPDLVADITPMKLVRAAIVVVCAYGGGIALEQLVTWLSERVALRFRLTVKQSLPLCRAFLFGLAGVLLIDSFFNLSSQRLIAVTGTAAVALGFAFKDYASSVIAGIIALFEGPYQVGDRVAIGEHYGEIISYGLRGILIQTPDDNIVTIPHNKLWTEAISNANKGNVEAQTVVSFYCAHEVDIPRVQKILRRAAQTSKYTQLDFPIAIVLDERPWGTHFKLKCYPIDARDEFQHKTDLIARAKQALTKAGIPYPRLPVRESDEGG